MTPTRRALTVAGTATLVLSLVLSIAPALAANGNGNGNGNDNGNSNSGTIKIHDAETGQEVADSDNDPHVCAFWVGFYTQDAPETGSWELRSWAPTGDGSLVSSGDYDTSGDGMDTTGTLAPAAGHHRFEWWQDGDSNGKHKTLWVDACGTDEEPAGEDATPTPTPTPVVTATATPTPTPAAATPTPTPTPVAATPTPDEDVTPLAPPSDSAAPSQTPEEQVQHGNPGASPSTGPGGAEDHPALGGGYGDPTLPDTAVPLGESGILATIGLMLIVAAHAGKRRERTLPTA
jgi:cell division septation protein DedD